MKINKKLVFLVASITVIAIIVWKIVTANSVPDPRKQTTPIVQTELPHRETVVNKRSFTGDVNPIQQANIYSKVNGNLERVFVNIGSIVRKNQLLALIDTTELAQQVLQTQATFENTNRNFERTKDLYARSLVAKQDFDNAEAAMKVAKANYQQASIRLDYAHITAPFAGIITKRYLDQGSNVTSNDKILFTLVDPEAMKVIVNVLEKDIPLITTGKRGVITVDAYPGKEFYGTVTRFSGAVDLSTRTMEVEIDIPNADHLLKPGMYANVALIVDEHKNAITVPTQSILKDDKGYFVYAVDTKITKRKNVSIGTEQNARMEILSGLEGVENIITVGQQFVKDSSQVQIK